MTCWLTAYEMLFNSGGENVTQFDIENRLTKGGFCVGAAKGMGLSDDDFVKASEILGTGTMYPGCLWSFGGLRSKLQLYGSLWVALFVCPDFTKPKERFHHIIASLRLAILQAQKPCAPSERQFFYYRIYFEHTISVDSERLRNVKMNNFLTSL